MYWLHAGFVLAHLLPLWVPTYKPIYEQKDSIFSGSRCNFDVIGYISNNMDTINRIYT